MEIPMFRCDCGSETLCVTRIVLRCGEDGQAEHVIEVADGTRRSLLLDWRVVRILVVGEFHLGPASPVHAEVGCARCGAPAPDSISAELLDRDLPDSSVSDLVVLSPAPRHDPNPVRRARAVA